jgi:hypothetical protein
MESLLSVRIWVCTVQRFTRPVQGRLQVAVCSLSPHALQITVSQGKNKPTTARLGSARLGSARHEIKSKPLTAMEVTL